MSPHRPFDPATPADPDRRPDLRSRALGDRTRGTPADVDRPAAWGTARVADGPWTGDARRVADTSRAADTPRAADAPRGDTSRAETARVVSGRVGTWDEAERVRRALLDDGFAADQIEVFYTGPAGRHAVTGIGGDAHADAGSTRIGAGAFAGGAAGAAAGLAVGAVIAGAPVAGPVLLTAAALGAFGGSLIGGVAASEDGSTKPDTAEHPVAKPGGVVIAVRTDRIADGERLALRRLEDGGAIALERATARWLDGCWVDWDPVAPREQLSPRPGTPQA